MKGEGKGEGGTSIVSQCSQVSQVAQSDRVGSAIDPVETVPNVLGTRERLALWIKVAINTATVKECSMLIPPARANAAVPGRIYYPGWSTFRDGRVGMWIFSEGGCAGRACELCVSETADIFATKIICQIDYVRNDKRQFTKLICYSK
ncbi:PREDICTED: uncharacterized protein LOC108764172 [Trachymyrmex cornetzi]|uniref:uncharacterized protein LOC108764172 n=1 Tax=Trachymyrmex cornetzi TaxID=471704 RepID=UPI00084F41C3|nr:PREDICTED: uncharacterized protein LOC108764172 [Trachymyrmex cornetzi]